MGDHAAQVADEGAGEIAHGPPGLRPDGTYGAEDGSGYGVRVGVVGGLGAAADEREDLQGSGEGPSAKAGEVMLNGWASRTSLGTHDWGGAMAVV